MKRSLALLLISTLMICSLAGCGCSADPQSGMNNAPGQEDAAAPNDGVIMDDNTADSTQPYEDPALGGNSPVEEGIDDIRDGIDHAMDDVTGKNESGGVSYGEMLRNGRVKNSALAKDGIASHR